jgi:nucleoid-associated protein YgaU
MEKLTIQNIVDAFVAQTGASKKVAEGLGRAFFDVIIEGLKEDGVVKINGLGTFKLVNVAPRESVNVNNGERIVIEGYKKVTFAPIDSVADVSEVTAVVQKKAKKDAAKTKKPAEKKETKKTVVEDSGQFGGIDSLIATPESAKVVKKAAEKVEKAAEKVTPAKQAEKPVETPKAETPKAEAPKKAEGNKNNGKLVKALLCIAAVAICILLAVKFCGGRSGESEEAAPVEEPVVEQPKDTVPEQKTYVLQRGDFLAKISREVYGTADSVNAIIRLNKITNPDSIEVGTVLLMP